MKSDDNWMSKVIWIFVAALIGAVVYSGFNLATNAMQAKEPKLTYYSSNASVFSGQNIYYAFYDVYIVNSGKAVVDNVAVVIMTPSMTITDSQVTGSVSIPYTHSINKDTLNLQVDELNPSESLKISLFTTGLTSPPNKPNVSLRGSGVTGNESNTYPLAPQTGLTENLFSVLLTAIIGLGGYILLYRGASNGMYLGKNKESQNYVLAYLCGVNGLLVEADTYLKKPIPSQYWAEADHFASQASVEPNSARSNKLKQVLVDLLNYAQVNRMSKALINYDIARIEFAQGKTEEAKQHLLVAKKQAKEIVNFRLSFQSDLSAILKST